MDKLLASVFVLASIAAPAAAQQATVPLDVFLEQRVSEELAADGTILSRLGVSLDVEIVGDKLIVSLVDPATRRAIASTKVDAVPTDREAAVAAVTQVVANLTTQLQTAPQASDASVIKDELAQDRARRDAEYQYRQEAISFGNELAVWSNGKTTSVGSITVAYQGDMQRKLSPHDFYDLVGRDDLASDYDHRVTGGWVGLIGGTALTIAGTVLYARYKVGTGDCDIFNDNYDQCVSDYRSDHSSYRTAGLVMAGGGLVAMIVGAWYAYHPNPVDESEVYNLAAGFNQRARQKHGLPTSSVVRSTPERSFVVAPTTLGDGGGLAVMGRF